MINNTHPSENVHSTVSFRVLRELNVRSCANGTSLYSTEKNNHTIAPGAKKCKTTTVIVQYDEAIIHDMEQFLIDSQKD
jgi:hypothetical protein